MERWSEFCFAGFLFKGLVQKCQHCKTLLQLKVCFESRRLGVQFLGIKVDGSGVRLERS